MSGFRLHIGGQFDFKHPISYVGGSVIDDWDIEPGCLTLDTLNRAIAIMGVDGSVLTIHYNRPGISLGAGLNSVETNHDVNSLVLAWKEVGSIDIYVVHMRDVDTSSPHSTDKTDELCENDALLEEEHGIDSDEDWLDDVDYGSEHKNEELNEYLDKAKCFVDKAATKGFNKHNAVTGDIQTEASDSDYSVGMDYEDNDNLNWSLTDEEELANEVQELIKHSDGVSNTRWRKFKKFYFNPECPTLRLHMIFDDPVQFREALIETSIESGYPFNIEVFGELMNLQKE
ncbi:hypothetical protein ACFE04_029350 [Oxalis oulophora]